MSEAMNDIVDAIRTELTVLNGLRDATLARSRSLTRACAHAIRAIHRHEWADADELLAQARAETAAMVDAIAGQPTLYHAGYTQDALKEVVEAHLVNASVRGLRTAHPRRPARDRPHLPARHGRSGHRNAALCARPHAPRPGDRGGALPRVHGRDLQPPRHRRLPRRRHRRSAPPYRRAALGPGAHPRRSHHGHPPGPDAPGAARLRANLDRHLGTDFARTAAPENLLASPLGDEEES